MRSVGKEEAELRTSSVAEEEEEKLDEYGDVDPQDLEYVRQIQRVSSLLIVISLCLGYRCCFSLSALIDSPCLYSLRVGVGASEEK